MGGERLGEGGGEILVLDGLEARQPWAPLQVKMAGFTVSLMPSNPRKSLASFSTYRRSFGKMAMGGKEGRQNRRA
jgi:hypothetical protein